MTADSLASFVAALGDLRVVLAGTALTAGFLISRGHYDTARAFLVGIVLCIGVTIVTKLIGRALEGNSLGDLIGSPSGHAALGTTFVGSLGMLMSHNRGIATRAATIACIALVVLAISYSRIVNGAHTPLEIAEGLFIGLIGLIPLAVLLRGRRAAHDATVVPAWRLVLLAAVLAAAHELLGAQDLDTEAVVRLLAGYLANSSH